MFGRRGNKRQAIHVRWPGWRPRSCSPRRWSGEVRGCCNRRFCRCARCRWKARSTTSPPVMKGFATAGFIHVDTEAVRREVEALPWVARATVVRLWPDRLRIVVKEQRAVALWGQDGLVSPDGRIFSPPPASYPSLDNGMALMLGRQEKSHERLLRFVRSYNRVLAARAEQIEQVDLRYTNGFAVRWKPAGDESKEMSNV